MFKKSRLILFLGLFFISFLSYAETKNSLSGEQSLEQQMPETTSLEMSKGEEDLSTQAGASILSVKGEALASVPLLFKFRPIIPVSLEFQVPCKENERFKYLVLVGGGGIFSRRAGFSPDDGKYKIEPYFSLDVGFKYDFQPWAVSLTAGGIVTPADFEKETEYALHPVLTHMKWALSVGRNIANTHVALTAGSFATVLAPFLGLSVSVPITKW